MKVLLYFLNVYLFPFSKELRNAILYPSYKLTFVINFGICFLHQVHTTFGVHGYLYPGDK